MNTEKIINERLQKIALKNQKVELGFIDEIKKRGEALEKEWKKGLNIAVDESKALAKKLDTQYAAPINKELQALKADIEESERLLKELGIGKNSDIERAKQVLKIAIGQERALREASMKLKDIY
jgi:hypothetical protein